MKTGHEMTQADSGIDDFLYHEDTPDIKMSWKWIQGWYGRYCDHPLVPAVVRRCGFDSDPLQRSRRKESCPHALPRCTAAWLTLATGEQPGQAVAAFQAWHLLQSVAKQVAVPTRPPAINDSLFRRRLIPTGWIFEADTGNEKNQSKPTEKDWEGKESMLYFSTVFYEMFSLKFETLMKRNRSLREKEATFS